MRILIIGGTKFVGRHLIRAALRSGHQISIFHRGRHPFESEGDIEEILGDRNKDLKNLQGRTWEAVIDTCGYLPQHVESSAVALRDSIGLYVYISSISAYADFSKPDSDEDAPLAVLTPEQEESFEKIDPLEDFNAYTLGELYGALKVRCEKAVSRSFPERSLIIRPGLIVGEFDWTDRFTYWVMRVAKGGEVLAPGNPNFYVQFIDGADLAEWMIEMIAKGETGIYNATGKPFTLSFGQMLTQMKAVSHSNAEFSWVDDEFMQENQIAPWTDMPVYLPVTPETKGHSAVNVDRALNKGLKFRFLKKTILDTYTWRKSVSGDLKAGISQEREQKLISILKEQNAD